MTDETTEKTTGTEAETEAEQASVEEPRADEVAEAVEEQAEEQAEESTPTAEAETGAEVQPEAAPSADEAEAEVEAEVEEAAAQEPEAEEPAEEEPAEEEEAGEPAEGEAAAEPEAEVKEEAPAEAEPAAEGEEAAEEGEVEGEPEAEAPKPEKKRDDLHWYVLRVQSNKEDSVRESLEKRVDSVRESLEKRVKQAALEDQITQVMVPTEKVSEIKSGKKRVTERKIYPGYVMIEMVMNDDTWYLVRETPGIGDFVGGAPNTRPMPMPQYEVDKMLGEAEKTEEEAPKLDIRFREGEAVKITEGPFENFNGVVKEVLPGKGLVKVEVTIFGRPTPVELEYWQIESI
jgi:transcriptional antiterminator NusG